MPFSKPVTKELYWCKMSDNYWNREGILKWSARCISGERIFLKYLTVFCPIEGGKIVKHDLSFPFEDVLFCLQIKNLINSRWSINLLFCFSHYYMYSRTAENRHWHLRHYQKDYNIYLFIYSILRWRERKHIHSRALLSLGLLKAQKPLTSFFIHFHSNFL